MLRTLVVFAALTMGWTYALQSALYAACLYLWIAYFRPEAWAWSDLIQTLNLSYIAGAYLVVRTIAAAPRVRVDLRSLLLGLFLLHSLLATSLGIDPAYSFANWWDFAKTIVVAYILTLVIQSTADLRLVLTVIALSLGFEAAKQGWAQMILNPGARNDNSVPFLGDNNLVAVGMAMLLPVIGALAATSTGWQKRLFQFFSVGVLYRGVSTYSRGGFLSFGAVGAIWFWRSPHKLRSVAAVALATALIVPILPERFWDRMATIAAPAGERDESQQGRLHFWQVAVAMANDRPFIGVGHSAYSLAYDDYDWTHGQYFSSRAVHSAWFGVLAESGYPGLAMFAGIVLLSLRACRRVRTSATRGEIPGPLGPYAVALESSLVAFVVGGSFVSFHYSEMLWHYFALTIALERVAVAEAAANRVRAESRANPAAPPGDAEPDFAWA